MINIFSQDPQKLLILLGEHDTKIESETNLIKRGVSRQEARLKQTFIQKVSEWNQFLFQSNSSSRAGHEESELWHGFVGIERSGWFPEKRPCPPGLPSIHVSVSGRTSNQFHNFFLEFNVHIHWWMFVRQVLTHSTSNHIMYSILRPTVTVHRIE